jgi:hypothetical protein
MWRSKGRRVAGSELGRGRLTSWAMVVGRAGSSRGRSWSVFTVQRSTPQARVAENRAWSSFAGRPRVPPRPRRRRPGRRRRHACSAGASARGHEGRSERTRDAARNPHRPPPGRSPTPDLPCPGHAPGYWAALRAKTLSGRFAGLVVDRDAAGNARRSHPRNERRVVPARDRRRDANEPSVPSHCRSETTRQTATCNDREPSTGAGSRLSAPRQ